MASSPHTTTTAGQLGPTTGAIYCMMYGPDFYRSFGNFLGDKGYGAAEFWERFSGGVKGAGDGRSEVGGRVGGAGGVVENKAGNYKATPRNLSTWEIDRMGDEAEKYKARIRLDTPVDTGYTPAVRTPKQADKRFMAHDILRALGKTPLDDDRIQYKKRRAMESSQVEEEPIVMARISSNEPSVKSTLSTSPLGSRTGTPAPSMPVPVSLPMPVPPWQPPIEEIAMLEEGEKEEEPEPQRKPEINLMELKRRRARDEEEQVAMPEACTRMREVPCQWFACTSVLNSLESVVTHLHEVHAQEDMDLTTCMWDVCGESFATSTQLALHAETHVLVWPRATALKCRFDGEERCALSCCLDEDGARSSCGLEEA
ncbi:hypothetical protein B0H14DRAFT_3779799 [Mycena olivaceomarginata]|nr:hypothetical protein B0H14DRAFT_3779799 [Mycena olivaceomarginata]